MEKVSFNFKYEKEKTILPTEVLRANVLELENLCRKGLKEKFLVELNSPQKITAPENVYELSVMLAEDLVKKYNTENIIKR